MTTLAEIEEAARRLPLGDKQRLLVTLAEQLRLESPSQLPPPRTFSPEEMNAWMDEDEQALKRLRDQC